MEELSLEELIAKIKDSDDKVRAAAWLQAGKVGAAAVKPLAAVMTNEDAEIARAAKRGLWVIVRHVGRPGATDERKAVLPELRALLDDGQPVAVRREAVWMISELCGGLGCVEPVAELLKNQELRDDARCCLQRLPGEKATTALIDALEAATDDFKYALAHAVRVRGVEVDEKKYPCQKMVPSRQTQVQPVAQ